MNIFGLSSCSEPSKVRSTLKISDLNAFFSSCPHLAPEDILDFELDIKAIRAAFWIKRVYTTVGWE